jgi:uncharacterized protein YqjF (DUF2071 family)
MSDFDYSILERSEHRPWPMPGSPWLMTQSWHDVLFAHWRVDASLLRRVVPEAFELDLFDGSAWVGVVPFEMTNVGPRATPTMPFVSAFPELNVRTYVRVGDKPGVYFFSLDAASRVAVAAARTLLNLPYYTADMSVIRAGLVVRYESARRTDEPAEFQAAYEATGKPFIAAAGSLEHFLTERYCLYHRNHRGRPYRLEIHHPPWRLQLARTHISLNTVVASSARLPIEGAPDLLHYAKRQDMVAWAPQSFIRSRRPAYSKSPARLLEGSRFGLRVPDRPTAHPHFASAPPASARGTVSASL